MMTRTLAHARANDLDLGCCTDQVPYYKDDPDPEPKPTSSTDPDWHTRSSRRPQWTRMTTGTQPQARPNDLGCEVLHHTRLLRSGEVGGCSTSPPRRPLLLPSRPTPWTSRTTRTPGPS